MGFALEFRMHTSQAYQNYVTRRANNTSSYLRIEVLRNERSRRFLRAPDCLGFYARRYRERQRRHDSK